MGDPLPESESRPPTLEYASGDATQSRWPWAMWSINAIVLVVLGAIILVVYLNRPRASATSTRLTCATNEKQLITAIVAYAKQNEGNLPPTLRAALAQGNRT